LSAAIVLGLGVPWFAQISMRSAGADTVIAWIPFPTWHTVTNAVLDISGAGWFGIVLAAVGLFVLLRRGERKMATWLVVWAFSPFAVAVVVSVAQHVFLDRYLIAAAPAFALLAALAVTGVARRLGATLLVVAAAATAVALVQWYSYAGSTNWRGEDWRAAAQFAAERSGGNEVVVVPWWSHAAAEYYGVKVASLSTPTRCGCSTGRRRAIAARIDPGAAGIRWTSSRQGASLRLARECAALEAPCCALARGRDEPDVGLAAACVLAKVAVLHAGPVETGDVDRGEREWLDDI
jgi:hypothetical protein